MWVHYSFGQAMNVPHFATDRVNSVKELWVRHAIHRKYKLFPRYCNFHSRSLTALLQGGFSACPNFRVPVYLSTPLNHQNSHLSLLMVDVGSKRADVQFTSGLNSVDSGPSYSEAVTVTSSTIVTPVGLQKEPLSPVSERYRLKKFHLQQKYDYIYMSNNRLRNRLYHIKKEINHLKRLKRVLCQRLFTFRDPFMDSCLEIPDNDPTSSTTEKISNDAIGKFSGNSKKKKAAEVKRVNQTNLGSRKGKSRDGLPKIPGARLPKDSEWGSHIPAVR
uniref:Uncharacterized protein n=1 Tax=Setaria digitata TaxID=48799 RepID=A0A915PQN1_9BILA